MAHRDERDALRAQVESLKRELSDAQAARDTSRATPPGVGAKLATALRSVRTRIAAIGTVLAETPPKWSRGRARGFGAIAALVLGGTLGTMLVWGAASEGRTTMTTLDIALIVGAFVGPPIGVGLSALALRAPGSVLGASAAAVGVVVMAVMIAQLVPPVRDAPRQIFLGRTQGTVETVSARPGAAWAEIVPAYVWLDHMGGASDTVMRDGRQVTRSSSAAPIVPAVPWSGATSLFVCGDENWLRLSGVGSGRIEGRVENAGGLELDAIGRTGVTVGPQPRCVSPSMWGAQSAMALGLVAMALWLVLFSLGGAWALMRIAGGAV